MQVVIDKSYLQGASAETLRGHCAEHTVLLVEALLYELLTTEEAVRRACFAKLSETNDDVIIIPSTGPLLQHEIQNQRPAYPLTDHVVPTTLQNLVTGVFSRPLDEHPALAQWKQDVQREVETFNQIAKGLSE